MAPDFDAIRQLFDMAPPEPSRVRGKKGKNAEQSLEFGRTAMGDADYETAIEHFRTAVEQSDSKHPWALMDLGAAYEAAGLVPQAFRQYERAKAIEASGEASLAVAAIYRQAGGRGADALRELHAAVEAEPENAYARHKLAEQLRDLGHRRDAVSFAETAVACAPDQAFYHYWLGELQLELGHYEEAEKALHAAIELSPGDDQLYFLAAQALWGQGKRPAAVRALRLASDINSQNKAYYALLERFLALSGMPDDAVLEAKKAAEADAYDQELVRRALKRLHLA